MGHPVHKTCLLGHPVHKTCLLGHPVHKTCLLGHPVHKTWLLGHPVHKTFIKTEIKMRLAQILYGFKIFNKSKFLEINIFFTCFKQILKIIIYGVME